MDTGDYDISTIKIDPSGLDAQGKKIVQLAREVAESIDRINRTLESLKLGWVSESADEAQEFSDRWIRVMREMFGENGGQIGVLAAMAGGISTAAIGFSHLETGLESSFTEFINKLASSGGDGGLTDHTGPAFPISQDYPN
ncbi:WXG100 family type VII secretion target [Streptomyces sp. NPDC093228]|uniref:WXG100 family type VII secretion target n=1 Tax=Streptomyces sp. NPDC093228 TaxID=3155070 RepID=UPI003424C513